MQGTNLNTRQTRKLATVVPNMPSALTAAGKWNLQRTAVGSCCERLHTRKWSLVG